MKTSALTLLIFIISLNCFSDDNLEITNFLEDQRQTHDKSHFESLGELMTTGERPDVDDIIDIPWSGRCYVKESPNTPTNSGYIFREKKWFRIPTGGAGTTAYPPQFPFRLPLGFKSKKISYEANSYWLRDKPEDYFDDLSIRKVNRLLRRDGAPYLKVHFLENGIMIRLSDGDVSILKRNGNYLIEEISREDSTVTNNGDAGVRCYYFLSNMIKSST